MRIVLNIIVLACPRPIITKRYVSNGSLTVCRLDSVLISYSVFICKEHISLNLDVLYVLSCPDLNGPSIMTYETPWDLASGIRLALTLDVPGSFGGFFN